MALGSRCEIKSRPKHLQLLHINGSDSSSRSDSDEDTLSITEVYPNDNLLQNKITIEDLKMLLDSNRDDYLTIDLRNSRLYQIKHIKGAVNYSCSSHLMLRRSQVRWKKYNEKSIYRIIVVYDEGNINETRENILAFIKLLSQSCENVKILNDGFKDFMQNCDEDLYLEESISKYTLSLFVLSPTHKDSLSSDVYMATMSEIIPNFLYVGNEMDAKDKETLKQYGITDIINVTSKVPHYYEKRFKYHRLPASDSETQDISQFFDEAFRIITSVKKNSGRVFIHCWAGVSRSVTIAMMYIMRSMNLDVLEALEYVKKRRSIADPNLNFLGQLSQIKL